MFANFLKYKLFIIRRERVVSVVWFVSLTGFALLLSVMYPGMFPTKESLYSLTATLTTPSMLAMLGPVYGTDAMTTAIAMAQQCLLWFGIAAIVMNIFFVNRHTRVDEELGRHEMLASLPVGRLTGSASTLVSAFALDMIIAVVIALLTLAVNVEGTTVAGAFCYGLSIGMQGFVFAAITLLMAQLFSTAHGSLGFAFGLMGASYIVRAIGDMKGSDLSLISPLGLGLRVEAFYTNAFAPIVILLTESVVIGAIAMLVNSRRDVGAGVFAARKGRDGASAFMRSPLGLCRRLVQRGFITWAIAMFVLGSSYGSVIGQLDSFVEGNDMIKQVLQGSGAASLAEGFLPMLSGIMAMIITVPVIGVFTRLRTEEKRGRLEQIYACAVPRGKMFASITLIAVVETVVLTGLTALGLYSASASTNILSFEAIAASGFSHIPAILVFAGLTAFLVGVAPKFVGLVWALFGYSFISLYFSRLFDMPDWAVRISPYGNVPQIPIEELAAAPLAILSAIAVALGIVGYVSYRRRDIAQ
ncbi:MAG: hypothetical protein LBC65_04415 [Oscillospiraceae bacterium]|jgi:ABC-2 type transport system permease protein|nr:hypothetical protein [Oscillospiraceae bacterium]